MVHSNACIAWRLFHLNWIPIAAMGGVLLFGVMLCGFSFEPVAAGIPTAIAAALALTVYLYAFAKGDQADPKLIFSLGAISQLLFVCIVMGPLTYVTGVANWPLRIIRFWRSIARWAWIRKRWPASSTIMIG